MGGSQLQAGQELHCDGGSTLIIKFCKNGNEREVKDKWYTIPHVLGPVNRDVPLPIRGRDAKSLSPILPDPSTAPGFLKAEAAGINGKKRHSKEAFFPAKGIPVGAMPARTAPAPAKKRGTKVSTTSTPAESPESPNPFPATAPPGPSSTSVRVEEIESPAEVEGKESKESPLVTDSVRQPLNSAARIEFWLSHGNEARELWRYEKARQAYEQTLIINPRVGRAFYGIGNVSADQGQWLEAEAAYRQALDINPDEAQVHVALAYVLTRELAGHDQNERLKEANVTINRAITLQPENAVAYDVLGMVLEAQGRPENAEQAYRRSIQLKANSSLAYMHLAHLIQTTDLISKAKPYYQQAIKLAQDARTLVMIADTLQLEGLNDTSEAPLQRALALEPANPEALYLLGRLLLMRQQSNKAIPLLQMASQLGKDDFSSHYLLAVGHLQTQHLGDAEKSFARAAELASAEDRRFLAGLQGFAGLGDRYLMSGQIKDALRVYERALEFDPGNAQLQARIASARLKEAMLPK